MKTIPLLLAIGSLGLASPGFAALPPLYQSAHEIKAILEDDELAASLGAGGVIESIEKNESGYEIRTERKELQVDVIPQPQDKPGPVQFKLHFHKATPE